MTLILFLSFTFIAFTPRAYGTSLGRQLSTRTEGIKLLHESLVKYNIEQECIPVACVLPTEVAICWKVSAQCMLGLPPPPSVGLDTPQLWAWSPPGCGPRDPPECRPGDPPPGQTINFPLWCGPGDLQGMLGYHPSRRPARHAGDLQGMLGYNPS